MTRLRLASMSVGLLSRPALLAAGLLGAAFAAQSIPGGLEPAAIGDMTRLHPLAGPIVFVGLGAVATAIGLPRQIVAVAGGYAFGVSAGIAPGLLAQMIGCVAGFVWARVIGREWTMRRMTGRLQRIDRLAAARPFTMILMLRLLPVGNNTVLTLLAGLSTIAATPFLTASLIGYLPQTIVFALIGSGVRFGQGAQVAIAAGLLAASLGLIGHIRRTATPAVVAMTTPGRRKTDEPPSRDAANAESAP